MEFKVKVLANRRSIGLRSVGAENMAQAESGLLEIVREHLGARPADVRWFYEVKEEARRKILFYAKVGRGKEVRVRVEILAVDNIN